MPYRKVKNSDGTVSVYGPSGVHAFHTTEHNADAQIRLLHGIDKSKKFADKIRQEYKRKK